jgi:hypothetical protein
MVYQYAALLAQACLVRANTVKPISASVLKADLVNAEQVAAIGQEETSGVLLIERAPDPETDDTVPIARLQHGYD